MTAAPPQISPSVRSSLGQGGPITQKVRVYLSELVNMSSQTHEELREGCWDGREGDGWMDEWTEQIGFLDTFALQPVVRQVRK